MRPRLLIFARAQDHLGFGRLARDLAAAMAGLYDVHLAAPDVFSSETPGGWMLHHNPDGFDIGGLKHLEQTARRLQPAVALLIGDYWLLSRPLHWLRASSRAKVVEYFPFDGQVRPNARPAHLGDPDRVVVYNRFGFEQFAGACGDGRIRGQAVVHRVATIAHGVDPARFYPIADRGELLSGLFPHARVKPDAFVVLNANRNAPRKRIDLTIQGFAAFARGKPSNVLLCLNLGLKEIGVDVIRTIRSLGLQDRVLLTATGDQHPRLSLDRLNQLFNACAVGISTSLGEGWGLVPFEHALTGSAQVLPAHTAFAELWTGAAEMMPAERLEPLNMMLEGWSVTPEAVCQALERLYSDRSHLARLQTAATARASERRFSWSVIAHEWDRVFEEALAA